jgi:hypothetical protein
VRLWGHCKHQPQPKLIIFAALRCPSLDTTFVHQLEATRSVDD